MTLEKIVALAKIEPNLLFGENHPSTILMDRLLLLQAQKQNLDSAIALAKVRQVYCEDLFVEHPHLTKEDLIRSLRCLVKRPFNTVESKEMLAFISKHPDIFVALPNKECVEVGEYGKL